MYGTLARRAALAVSALIALVDLVSGPTTASANSLFQGAVASPSPSPTPVAGPAGVAWPGSAPRGVSWSAGVQQPDPVWSGGAQPPTAPSPTSSPLPPDVKVTSLGIVRGAAGVEAYAFQVTNVGKGSASELKITRQAVVKRKGQRSWVRTEVSTSTHAGGLRPGQELVVEVTCPASDKQYCDVGGVLADVVGTPADADPSNNHMTEFGDIKG